VIAVESGWTRKKNKATLSHRLNAIRSMKSNIITIIPWGRMFEETTSRPFMIQGQARQKKES